MTRHDRKLEKAIRPLFADPITVIHFLWELNIFFCFQIPTSIPKNNKPTPWWSKNLSKAIKAKQLSFTKYKHSKSRSDYATYAAKRNDVKCKIRSARNSYERSLLDKLRSNPKALYSYIKSKQKIRPSIGPLIKSDGSLTADDQEVTETLTNSLSQHLPKKIYLVCLFPPLCLKIVFGILT